MENVANGNLNDPKAKRAAAALMLQEGKGCAEIAEELGLSRQTVYRWRRLLDAGGEAELLARARLGSPPLLSEQQQESLLTALNRPPSASGMASKSWSLKTAANFVHKEFSETFTEAGISRLLRNRGVSIKSVRIGKP